MAHLWRKKALRHTYGYAPIRGIMAHGCHKPLKYGASMAHLAARAAARERKITPRKTNPARPVPCMKKETAPLVRAGSCRNFRRARVAADLCDTVRHACHVCLLLADIWREYWPIIPMVSQPVRLGLS